MMILRQALGTASRASGSKMRDELAAVRRIVVKVGSSSLTTPEGGIDPQRIEQLVDVLAGARLAGRERSSWSHPERLLLGLRRWDYGYALVILRLSKRLLRSVRAC